MRNDRYLKKVNTVWQDKAPLRLRARRFFLCGLAVLLLIGGAIAGVTRMRSQPVLLSVTVGEGSQTNHTAEDFCRAANLAPGNPLHAKTKRDIAGILLEAFPEIDTVNVQKNKKTGTIVLSVKEKVPVFYVVSGTDYYLFDKSCTLFRRTRDAGETAGRIRLIVPDDALPAMRSPLDFGDDGDYMFAFLRSVFSAPFGSHVTAVSLTKRYDLRIMLDDRIVLFWGSDEYAEQKINVLSALLMDGMFAEGRFATVDLNVPSKVTARPYAVEQDVRTAFLTP